MKQVFLKEGPLMGEQQLSTKYLIKVCLDNPPAGGFQYRHFKERARVENAMDDEKFVNPGNSLEKYFDLEDRDWDVLAKCVKDQPWNVRDKFIVEFVESFLDNKIL